MRRSPLMAVLVLLLLSLAVLTGCGNDNKTTPVGPAKLVLALTATSLNFGDVQQAAFQFQDADGNQVSSSETVTFSSSNTNVATISSAGVVCGGAWDANFVNCTPKDAGTTQITATGGGLTSDPVTVFVHARVDQVRVAPDKVDCKSQDETQQFTATAFSGGNDITDSVGAFSWNTGSGTVATVNSDGVVTAQTPGRTSVFASISGTSSTPAEFVTCPVQEIGIQVKDGTDTTVTLEAAKTQQLEAEVVDVAGKTLADASRLSWSSSQPAVATISTAGLATTVAPGTAILTGSCQPPRCNIGLDGVYSNTFVLKVSGTSATTAVYAANTGGTSLVPIDTSNNTAGTAITLPDEPNSMVFNPAGTQLYMGSATGLMVFDVATNAVTTPIAVAGKVLGISPNSNLVVIAGASTTYVYDIAASRVTGFAVANATGASFVPDSTRAIIAAGSKLHEYSTGTLSPTSLAAPANDVAVVGGGALTFVAGGDAAGVEVRATCNLAHLDAVNTGAAPLRLRPLPTGEKVLALETTELSVITPSTDRLGCPPSASNTLATHSFPAGTEATGILVLPDGSRAYIANSSPDLLVYDVAGDAVSTISVAGDAHALNLDSTLDSATVFAGGSDDKVHRIDVAGGTDEEQITLSFTPDLLAVRPR